MRAYKVHVATATGAKGQRFAGSQAQVREHRDELMEKFGVKKSAVEVEEIEISLAKPDLLAFINDIAVSGDQVEGED